MMKKNNCFNVNGIRQVSDYIVMNTEMWEVWQIIIFICINNLGECIILIKIMVRENKTRIIERVRMK